MKILWLFLSIILVQTSLAASSYKATPEAQKILNFLPKFNQWELTYKCSNGANPAWAKLQIGADLAEYFIQNKFKKIDATKFSYPQVSVIDSGFDAIKHTKNIMAHNFTITSATDESGREDVDFDGHGTAVIGAMNAAVVGVTSFLDLTSYRVTPAHAGGSVSTTILDTALEKACAHSDIVNLSWGSLFDEMGFGSIYSKEKSWEKLAKKRGCLIVKSAGNSGIKNTDEKRQEYFEENPTTLYVASTNSYDLESYFSTVGMVSAPGEKIYTILSSKHEYGDSTKKNICNLKNIELAPINGTSFSSPIVAAVAAQVLTVLKMNNKVPSNGLLKVNLLKKILKASSLWNKKNNNQNGLINALAAVYIADQITDAKMSEEEMVNLVSNHKNVSCSYEACKNIKTSEGQYACLQVKRHQIFSCPNSEIKAQQVTELFTLYKNLNEREQADHLISSKNEFLDNKNKLENLISKWNGNTINKDKKISIDNFDQALNIVQVAKNLKLEAFFTPSRFETLIGKNNFEFTPKDLKDNKNKATSLWVKAQLVLEYFNNLSSEDQTKVLMNIPAPVVQGNETFWKINTNNASLIYLLAQNANAKNKIIVNQVLHKIYHAWTSNALMLNGDFENSFIDYSVYDLNLLVPLLERSYLAASKPCILDFEKISYTNFYQQYVCYQSTLVTPMQKIKFTDDFFSNTEKLKISLAQDVKKFAIKVSSYSFDLYSKTRHLELIKSMTDLLIEDLFKKINAFETQNKATPEIEVVSKEIYEKNRKFLEEFLLANTSIMIPIGISQSFFIPKTYKYWKDNNFYIRYINNLKKQITLIPQGNTSSGMLIFIYSRNLSCLFSAGSDFGKDVLVNNVEWSKGFLIFLTNILVKGNQEQDLKDLQKNSTMYLPDILSAIKSLKNENFKAEYKKVLTPLKVTILKEEDKFPSDVVLKIKSLFDIPEN